jgi:hypothetical protein
MYPEAVRFVRRAKGLRPYLAYLFVEVTAHHPDPGTRALSGALAEEASRNLIPFDPIEVAAIIAESDGHEALSFLENIDTQGDYIGIALESFENELAESKSRLNGELAAVRDLVSDVEAITAEGGSRSLAANYAKRANNVEVAGNWMVCLSVLTGLFVAVLGLRLGLQVSSGGISADDALKRGALGLPFLGLGAYFASLGASFRNESLRWRHIELQISSVNPFLARLGDRRADLLAVLAPMFFPGQSQYAGGGGKRDEDAAGGLTAAQLVATLEALLEKQRAAVSSKDVTFAHREVGGPV